jgi:hypothetical protein
MPSAHSPTEATAPLVCVPPQSSGASTLNGSGIDLTGRRGVLFTVGIGDLTGSASVAAYLRESDDNSTFTNVNTTTYPEATLAAATTANTAREMAYAGGGGRKRYVRADVVVAVNTALVSATAVRY